MQANSFATVVSQLDGALVASHLPLLTRIVDGHVIILGHFAKASPHWRAFEQDQRECLVIFTGPHTFVSPTTYIHNHGIPTWNYIAVHATGIGRVSHDTNQKLEMLHQMHSVFEPENEITFAAQPASFQAAQLAGIVWFEVTVSKLEGKAKLSQHHTIENQRSASQALVASPNTDAKAIGGLMRDHVLAVQAKSDSPSTASTIA